jgi:hypothetical protein
VAEDEICHGFDLSGMQALPRNTDAESAFGVEEADDLAAATS